MIFIIDAISHLTSLFSPQVEVHAGCVRQILPLLVLALLQNFLWGKTVWVPHLSLGNTRFSLVNTPNARLLLVETHSILF